MGLHGISIGSLAVVVLVVLVIFGTKRLRNIGTDLGGALKNFRQGLSDADADDKS